MTVDKETDVMCKSRRSLVTPLAILLGVACMMNPVAAQQGVSPAEEGQTVDVSNREELIAAVRAAVPGTTVRLSSGEYAGGLSFDGLRGTRARPIVIEARDAARPPEIVGGGSGIHLRAPAYVQLRGLVLRNASGNGLNIDDGGNAGEPARGIHLSGIQVRDVGPKGNHDGIKLSGLSDFVVEDCVIERWGESGSAVDMVGCHAGEVRGCQFRYRGDIFGNGVQTKGGSARHQHSSLPVRERGWSRGEHRREHGAGLLSTA
ncbi:MAG: hypothetical protein R3B90_04335 [Planctomycetaceae bacterium]